MKKQTLEESTVQKLGLQSKRRSQLQSPQQQRQRQRRRWRSLQQPQRKAEQLVLTSLQTLAGLPTHRHHNASPLRQPSGTGRSTSTALAKLVGWTAQSSTRSTGFRRGSGSGVCGATARRVFIARLVQEATRSCPCAPRFGRTAPTCAVSSSSTPQARSRSTA